MRPATIRYASFGALTFTAALVAMYQLSNLSPWIFLGSLAAALWCLLFVALSIRSAARATSIFRTRGLNLESLLSLPISLFFGLMSIYQGSIALTIYAGASKLAWQWGENNMKTQITSVFGEALTHGFVYQLHVWVPLYILVPVLLGAALGEATHRNSRHLATSA